MTKHLYRTLTWPEVRERAQQRAVIVIPVAAIEQHGHHLPIDVDNVLVEHVTEEAARRSEGLILTAPMIHYGFNEHNMGFPGTISIREYVFIDFCYDVAHSFTRQGFTRIVFVNGHGSNQMLCNLAARRINNTTSALAGAVAHWALAKEAVDRLRESEFPGGMAHACEFETAMYLHIKPELVDMSKAGDRETPSRQNRFVYDDLFGSGPVHMVNRWSRISESGVEGDPRLATPEKGKAFAECAIENLVEFCRLFRSYQTPPDRDFNYHP
ncbi:MAG TPA: creatininase family protein [Bryobacteraceae bacterium]|nr:creatininase family protein [Bryobacteraceae bacterium]